MKRWIIPVLGALAAHWLLFSIDPQWSRPVWRPPQHPTLQLSLVDPPPKPAVVPPKPPSPPASAPLKPPRTKPVPPAPVKAPAPAIPAPTPAPTVPMREKRTEQGVSKLEAAPPASSEERALPADAADTVGEAQAQVQASVPLYDLNPPPVYPVAARRRNLQGTVLLEVLVDRQGRAARVRVLRGSGHAMLDRSALDSVRKWRFRPALRGGRPQEMWVQVPVRFELQ